MKSPRQIVLRVLRYAFAQGGTTALVARAASLVVSAGLIAGFVAWFGGWRAAAVVLLLGVVAIAASIGAYRLAAELGRYEDEPRPHLVFTDTEVAPAAVVGMSMEVYPAIAATANPGYVLATDTAYMFARVRVANDPPAGRQGQRAERVGARVVFLDEEGRSLVEMDGRWSETPQQLERGTLAHSLEGAQLDIDANAISHPIDIAMKRPGEEDFFAYNDENAQGERLGLAKHRLSGEQVLVRVTLRPANGDRVVREFVLRNGGSDGTLEIAFADGPPTQ